MRLRDAIDMLADSGVEAHVHSPANTRSISTSSEPLTECGDAAGPQCRAIELMERDAQTIRMVA